MIFARVLAQLSGDAIIGSPDCNVGDAGDIRTKTAFVHCRNYGLRQAPVGRARSRAQGRSCGSDPAGAGAPPGAFGASRPPEGRPPGSLLGDPLPLTLPRTRSGKGGPCPPSPARAASPPGRAARSQG